MALTLVLSALVLLLVIGWVVSGIRVVHAHHRGVLERFGRYRKVIGPGPHLTLRLVHTIQIVDERETVQDVPVDVLTGDDIPVALDLAVLWECSDPRRFVYDVGDFGVAISRLLEHHVRGLVRQLTVDELLSGDSRLTDELTHSLDEVALTWGARVTRVELCQVVLPEEVSVAMTELATAQRHRLAVLVEEESALEIEAVRAEGEHQARLAPIRGPPGAPPHGGRAQGRGHPHPRRRRALPRAVPGPGPGRRHPHREQRRAAAGPAPGDREPAGVRGAVPLLTRPCRQDGVKRRGRRSGPQMPNVSGFHVMSPSRARSGIAPGQDGQGFLELGPGQRRTEAVVDAAPEGQLRRGRVPAS